MLHIEHLSILWNSDWVRAQWLQCYWLIEFTQVKQHQKYLVMMSDNRLKKVTLLIVSLIEVTLKDWIYPRILQNILLWKYIRMKWLHGIMGFLFRIQSQCIIIQCEGLRLFRVSVKVVDAHVISYSCSQWWHFYIKFFDSKLSNSAWISI